MLPSGVGSGWRDRGQVVVMLAVAIALGATSLLDAEALLAHQAALSPASDSTMRRALSAVDDKVRGFPWLSVAGRRLTVAS
ncbi:hypothetical protein GXW82_33805 [Streptacidiphilus sp. 4-A2]|nr:hypothetical protein [Streptacidiphilus sp. 4-A2]